MIKCMKINKNNFLIYLSIITCLTSAPYITHYLFGGMYAIISASLSVILFISTLKYYRKDNWIIALWLFAYSFIIYGIIMFLSTNNMGDMRKAFGMLMKTMYVISSSFLIQKNYNKYISVFFTINNVIIILSIILFVVLLIIPLEPITFIKQDGRSHFLYLPFGATNVRYYLGGFYFIRIAGIADEPGALALIISHLLVLNEMTMKSRSNRILYIVGGTLTFSMAFFITIIPMLIYWVNTKVLQVKYFAIISIFIIGAIITADKDTAAYQAVDTLVLGRFTQNDDGTLAGDNRSASVPKQLEAFYSSPILGVGYNDEKIVKYELGIPSFFSYLGTHGIIGYILFYIPFVFLFVYKREYRLILLVIALNFLQRPSIEEMFTLISFTLMYYSNKYEKSTTNLHNYSIV